MNRALIVYFCCLWFLNPSLKAAQLDLEDHDALQRTFDRWNEPVAPFHVVGNILFVGMRNISSFLLVGNEGHILIDTGFSNSVPMIQSNIVRLGFSPRDVKYILSSHAHCDHVAGHAGMKRATGAKVAISKADAVLLESGGKKDFLFGEKSMMQFEAVSPDLLIQDRDQIRLGNIRLTAHLTPGHTPGCTTWKTQVEEDGKRVDVVFFGSTSINPGTKLIANTAYPNIVPDIRSTYQKLRALTCDVFLAPHPEQFNMREKLERRTKTGPNPFIDPTALRTFLQDAEEVFERELAAQLGAEKAKGEVVYAASREITLRAGASLDLENARVLEHRHDGLQAFLDKSRRGWELIVEGRHNYFDEAGTAWQQMPAGFIAQPAGLAGLPMERKGFYTLPEKVPFTVLIPQWGLLRVKSAQGLESERPEIAMELKKIQKGDLQAP